MWARDLIYVVASLHIKYQEDVYTNIYSEYTGWLGNSEQVPETDLDILDTVFMTRLANQKNQ